jgi:hypothetical protein
MLWLLSALRNPDVHLWVGRCALLLGTASVLVLLADWWWSRWFQAFGQALHLMHTGEPQRAEESLRKLARAPGARRTAALAAVGVCHIHRGEYARAVALLEPLMERRLPRTMRTDEVALRGYLALCLAMLGETRRAWYWLGEAHRRFGGRVTFLVMPEVAILCREGHLGAALKYMEHCWPMLMADGLLCSRIRLLRAFAQTKVDPEHNVGPVMRTLLSLAPFPKKELAFCREHWPVLADFMQIGEDLVARHAQERARREAEWEAARKKKNTPTPEDGTSG